MTFDLQKLLHEYVDKQILLICKLTAGLDGSVNRFNFDEKIPRSVLVAGSTWAVRVHGTGVKFTNEDTGEVIDAHSGLLDAPDAFDAGRLMQYCESIKAGHEEVELWNKVFEHLAEIGVIKPSDKYRFHYVFANHGETSSTINVT